MGSLVGVTPDEKLKGQNAIRVPVGQRREVRSPHGVVADRRHDDRRWEAGCLVAVDVDEECLVILLRDEDVQLVQVHDQNLRLVDVLHMRPELAGQPDDVIVGDAVPVAKGAREELTEGVAVRHRVHRVADRNLGVVQDHLLGLDDIVVDDRRERVEFRVRNGVLRIRVDLVGHTVLHVDGSLTTGGDVVLLSQRYLANTSDKDLHGVPLRWMPATEKSSVCFHPRSAQKRERNLLQRRIRNSPSKLFTSKSCFTIAPTGTI